MPITKMKDMWALLDAYTMTPDGSERSVNHNNEWGGFSRRLDMPVFTAWSDMLNYDKQAKTTTALVSDIAWAGRPVGLGNQERWLQFAQAHGGTAAFFVIHAHDTGAQIRKVKYIDDDKVFVGTVTRNEQGQAHITGQPRKL